MFPIRDRLRKGIHPLLGQERVKIHKNHFRSFKVVITLLHTLPRTFPMLFYVWLSDSMMNVYNLCISSFINPNIQ